MNTSGGSPGLGSATTTSPTLGGTDHHHSSQYNPIVPHHHYQQQAQQHPSQQHLTNPYDHHPNNSNSFNYSTGGLGLTTQQHSPASVHSLDTTGSNSYSHHGSPNSAGSQRNHDTNSSEALGVGATDHQHHHHVRWSTLTPPHGQAQPQHNLA